jgi:hypothetical protein
VSYNLQTSVVSNKISYRNKIKYWWEMALALRQGWGVRFEEKEAENI